MELLLSKWFLFAGLVYTLVQFLKSVYDQANHKINPDSILALILGVVLMVLAKVDLLAFVGVTLDYPYVGSAFSGLLVGGAVGAGLIHDFPDWVKALFGKV